MLLKATHLHCGSACLEVVENTICEPHDCLCRPKMKLWYQVVETRQWIYCNIYFLLKYFQNKNKSWFTHLRYTAEDTTSDKISTSASHSLTLQILGTLVSAKATSGFKKPWLGDHYLLIYLIIIADHLHIAFRMSNNTFFFLFILFVIRLFWAYAMIKSLVKKIKIETSIIKKNVIYWVNKYIVFFSSKIFPITNNVYLC